MNITHLREGHVQESPTYSFCRSNLSSCNALIYLFPAKTGILEITERKFVQGMSEDRRKIEEFANPFCCYPANLNVREETKYTWFKYLMLDSVTEYYTQWTYTNDSCVMLLCFLTFRMVFDLFRSKTDGNFRT